MSTEFKDREVYTHSNNVGEIQTDIDGRKYLRVTDIYKWFSASELKAIASELEDREKQADESYDNSKGCIDHLFPSLSDDLENLTIIS